MSAYADRVLADGASYYWRLNESSGTVAADLAGGAPGTLTGGVTLGHPAAIAEGAAMRFDGTTGKIATAVILLPQVFTVEVWAKTTDFASYRPIVSTRPGSPHTGTVFLGMFTNGKAYIVAAGNPFIYSVGTINDGAWHHVVYVIDTSSVSIYIDGVLDLTTSGWTLPAQVASLLHIGYDISAYYWLGDLDEVAIYPRALTGPDIAAHYALAPIVALNVTTIEWIVRDSAGSIVSTTDLSDRMLHDSLQITQALHEEPDTCSFSLAPSAAAGPAIGQEIRVIWSAPDVAPLFHGYIVTIQSDWRVGNRQPPWLSIQCQDPMWRFDARLVTWTFPAQSVTTSIAFLVQYFCNVHPTTPHGTDFLLTAVQAGMPSIAAFDVVNQRPSTVMRTLMAAVAGGFYLEGFSLHAWAGSVSEPGQSNPDPLTVGLSTLKSFRLTTDGTQVRRRVIVEGRRTETLIACPAMDPDVFVALGLPLGDATIFPAGASIERRTRLGTQWLKVENPSTVKATGTNPPQTKTHTAFTPGDIQLFLKAMPLTPPAKGWLRIGNQYTRYESYGGTPTTDGWWLNLPLATLPYGVLTVPIPVGETVEWIDGIMNIASQGLSWTIGPPPVGDRALRAHPVSTPMITLAMAQTAAQTAGTDVWPPLEGFVQDGRYSYDGAAARASADLAAFTDPLVSMEWETEDANALPGRSQVIALTSAAVTPPVNTTITILRVNLRFPLRTRPPRRQCSGGLLKPSTFLDLVLTNPT